MQVDFTLLMPEFMLAGLGVLVLTADFAVPWASRGVKNGALAALTVLGLAVDARRHAADAVGLGRTQDSLRAPDLRGPLCAAVQGAGDGHRGSWSCSSRMEYVHSRIRHVGEFYALLVFAVLGASLMAGAAELLTAYIAIELLAFCLYVLVALSRGDARSGEAAVKYILLGAISSAVMLFGIALIYGAIGDTGFRSSERLLEAVFGPTVALGLGMFVAGLGFKLSMAPFHLWAPDVYEGAPTPVTALVSVLSKAAAFALTLRFLAEAGNATLEEWQLALAVLAALTMTVGTFTALVQENIKRLLAYSSVAQVGFVLIGVIALNESGARAALLHIMGYSFANLAAFAVVIAVEAKTGKERISDYAGLASRSPFLAMVMSAAMFSLAGLPIFAGFVTKFLLFTSAVEGGLFWLMVIAVANSLVSLYYYLRIVREMYVGEAAETRAPAFAGCGVGARMAPVCRKRCSLVHLPRAAHGRRGSSRGRPSRRSCNRTFTRNCSEFVG